jgi:hypothetical protein
MPTRSNWSGVCAESTPSIHLKLVLALAAGAANRITAASAASSEPGTLPRLSIAGLSITATDTAGAIRFAPTRRLQSP